MVLEKTRIIFMLKIKELISLKSLVILFIISGFINITAFFTGTMLLFYNPHIMTRRALVEGFSLILSGVLVIYVLTSLSGPFTITQTDKDYIFTSPIKPRDYLISALLLQLMMFNILFLSPILSFLTAVGSRLDITTINLLLTSLGLEIFALVAIVLGQVLGILNTFYRKAKFISLFILAFLLFPALRFTNVGVQPRYSELPYPSTFAAEVISDLFLGGKLSPLSVIAFLSYSVILFLCFLRLSKKNIFPVAKAAPLASVGQPSQTILSGKSVRVLTDFISLEPSDNLIPLLAKKEVIEIIRDGSWFFFLLMIIPLALTSLRGPSIVGKLLPIFGILMPPMFAWRVSECESLWIIFTSDNTFSYFKSLLITLAIITIATLFPFTLIISIQLPSSALVLPSLASSVFISSSSSIYIGLRFKIYNIYQPLTRIMYFSLLIMIVSLFSSPVLTLNFLLPLLSFQLKFLCLFLIIAYGIVITIALLKKIKSELREVEFYGI